MSSIVNKTNTVLALLLALVALVALGVVLAKSSDSASDALSLRSLTRESINGQISNGVTVLSHEESSGACTSGQLSEPFIYTEVSTRDIDGYLSSLHEAALADGWQQRDATYLASYTKSIDSYVATLEVRRGALDNLQIEVSSDAKSVGSC